jgi:hypothetical protein
MSARINVARGAMYVEVVAMAAQAMDTQDAAMPDHARQTQNIVTQDAAMPDHAKERFFIIVVLLVAIVKLLFFQYLFS